MNSNSLSHFFSKWTSHALLFTGAGTENPFLPKDNHDYERRKGTVEKNVIFRIEFSSSCFLRFFFSFLFLWVLFSLCVKKIFFPPSFHHSHHPSYTREQLKLMINIWRLAHLLFWEYISRKSLRSLIRFVVKNWISNLHIRLFTTFNVVFHCSIYFMLSKDMVKWGWEVRIRISHCTLDGYTHDSQ